MSLEAYLAKSGLLELAKLSSFRSKTIQREEFVKIMNLNIKIVDELFKEAKRLLQNGQEDESNRILDIASEVLNSNKQLQDTVVKVLSKSD